MPTIIRNMQGNVPKSNTKDFSKSNYLVEFTDDDRRFIDALKEFYTQGKSDLLDIYSDDGDK